MTRRIGGIGKGGLKGLAPLSLAIIVGCSWAFVGCGDDSSSGPGPVVDAAMEGGDSSPDARPGDAGDAGDAGDSQASLLAAPKFTPVSGTNNPGSVTIAEVWPTGVTGEILYTTNGTIPSAGSSTTFLYTAPVSVTTSETIIAVATATGLGQSVPASASYTVTTSGSDGGPDASDSGSVDVAPLPKLDLPTFTPAVDGGSLASGTTITINLPGNAPATFAASGGLILYTTNGSVPTYVNGVPTGSLYSGPIQLTASTTINAIAVDPGLYLNSNVASASYTITVPPPVDSGTDAPVVVKPATPTFAPPAQGSNNDFPVTLSSAGSTTICYTTDGTTPTVTAAGACATGSQTYNGTGINITGSITNATTGAVTVTAIAANSAGSSATASQIYTLTAATPTFIAPVPGTLLIGAVAGTTPTITSATSGAGFRYTIDGTTPSCTSGLVPQTTAQLQAALNQTTTVNAVACKTGYAPSKVGSGLYTLTFNPPTFGPPNAGTFDQTVTVTLANPTANGAASICYTTDGTAPTCTGSACNNVVYSTGVPLSTTGKQLQAIICGTTTKAASTVATSGAYTLQLDPPILDVAGAAGTIQSIVVTNGGSGYVDSAPPAVTIDPYTATTGGTAATAVATVVNGTVTAITLTNAGAGYTLNVPAVTIAAPTAGVTAVASAVLTPATSVSVPVAGLASAPTVQLAGAGANYDYACVAKSETPQCGTSTPCNAGTRVAGTSANTAGAALSASTAALPSKPVAGETWSVVGCSTSGALGSSVVTSVAFSGPGTAAQPTISPAAIANSPQPITPVFTNADTTGVTLCYSTTTTASCTAGACAAGSTSVPLPAPGVQTVKVEGFTITNPGSGYTSAPAVVISAPPAVSGATPTTATAAATIKGPVATLAVTQGGSGYAIPPLVTLTRASGDSTGSGATATATLTNGVVTGITLTNPGTAYTLNPTVSFSNTCSAYAVIDSSATLATKIVIDVVNGGSGFTTAPTVSLDGALSSGSISAVANLGTGTTAGQVVSVTVFGTYDYNGGTPPTTVTFDCGAKATAAINGILTGFTAAVGGGAYSATGSYYTTAPTVTISGGGGTGATATAILSTSSTLSSISISNTYSVTACSAAKTAPAAESVTYTFEDAEPDFTLDGTSAIGNLNAPATGQTIALGAKIDISTASTFGGATVYWTNDGTTPTCTYGSTATSYTVGTPATGTTVTLNAIACSGANQTASPVRTVTFTVTAAKPTITSDQAAPLITWAANPATIWHVPFTLGVTAPVSTDTGFICYSTDGSTVPTCNITATTASCATGTPAGNAGVGTATGITLNGPTTTIQAISCDVALGASAVASQTFTVTLPGVDALVTSTSACSGNATLSIDSSPASSSLGGPASVATWGAWATKNNVTIHYSTDGTTPNCAVLGSAYSSAIPLTSSVTIKAIPCSTLANTYIAGTVQTIPVSVTPFAQTITVDGNLSEWSNNVKIQTNRVANAAFTNDATNLYFGWAPSVGDTVATTSELIIFIGNGVSSTAATALPTNIGGTVLTTGTTPTLANFTAGGYQYAIQWTTSPATSPAVMYAWNGSAWAVATGITVNVVSSTNTTNGAIAGAEFSVLTSSLTQLGTSGKVDVMEAWYTGVPAAPALLDYIDSTGTGTGTAYTDGFTTNLLSCSGPSEDTIL